MLRWGLPLVVVLLGASAFGQKLERHDRSGDLTVYAVSPDVLRIDFVRRNTKAEPTVMLDRRGLRRATPTGTLTGNVLTTAAMRVEILDGQIVAKTLDGNITLKTSLSQLGLGVLRISHAKGENLYGMRGLGLYEDKSIQIDPKKGLLRNDGAPILAGQQGDGGAPMAYTTHWGVLIDSIQGRFETTDDSLSFELASRPTVEAYLVLGPPKRTIAVATDLTGHPQMPPKWTLGFMNSQWGATQAEVTDIIGTYRQKQIPIDGFILDFDFKAWGEDNYGEFRWNSTSGAGATGPNKFPDGASGKFARDLCAQGIKVVGIMKPRILLTNSSGGAMKGAQDMDAMNGWLPGQKPFDDYFSHRKARELDLENPAVRNWFWQKSKNLFDDGIVGWWNDEADGDQYNSLGHFYMQQALYEGQRHVSDQRAWSLNRNFYLGSQRFAFATWSGDIGTGFRIMAAEPARMLSLTSLAQPHWSMDTGGFGGHPSPENYARWMEFASVVPIMRVHNTYGEHRQPWVYGPIAEAAAKKAIERRYSLIPSLYSWENDAHQTGVGVVRPLFWEFPEDSRVANMTQEWMFGDQFLVAPILEEGATERRVYFPGEKWFDYASDRVYLGSQSYTVPVDRGTWSDLPMYVRSGSIVATQPVTQFVGEHPVQAINLDIWPDANRPAQFRVYDDDGSTYAYERGTGFTQDVTATVGSDGSVTVNLGPPSGSYKPSFKVYSIRVHGHETATAMYGELKLESNQGRLTVPTQRGIVRLLK